MFCDYSNPKGEDDVAPGLGRWRNAVAAATSASQLCLCLGMLENCIAWDKSIMKVVGQMNLSYSNSQRGKARYYFKKRM